jgi:hypothetical protein
VSRDRKAPRERAGARLLRTAMILRVMAEYAERIALVVDELETQIDTLRAGWGIAADAGAVANDQDPPHTGARKRPRFAWEPGGDA